ncbi:hypothetical protein LBMAG53_28760 [Planctomycetota bacterium]|nr:hypothetical protein LBMAG53_28760 [Planctomycetota bacterium]
MADDPLQTLAPRTVLDRAVDKGLISPEIAKDIGGRSSSGAEAADLLVTEGFLTRHLVATVLSTHTPATNITAIQQPVEISGFVITGVLGQGGMGTVYRATQRSLGRQVALKVISPESAADPEFAERFLREARSAGSISHPNVITCFDAGIDKGQPYMALELVTGGDAAQKARKTNNRLSERETLRIGIDCARGLIAIRRAGLIHRDIKPSNIFITEDGIAKLADLGLARSSAGDDRMTMTGRAMGTPAFMSPEQAQGLADVDIRSDICALGGTLFCLLTGSLPYHGATTWVVVAKVMNDPVPDPRALVPEVSAAAAAVVMKAMAKDRAQRYQDPEALLADLELVLAGSQPKLAEPTSQIGTARATRADATQATIALREAPTVIRPPSTQMMPPPEAPASSPAKRSWSPVGLGLAAGLAGAAITTFLLLPGRVPAPPSESPPATANPVGGAAAAPTAAAASPAAVKLCDQWRERLLAAGLRCTVEATAENIAISAVDPGTTSLAPLADAPVERLDLTGCLRLTDLTPLARMPLRRLLLNGCVKLERLDGLEKTPLAELDASGCTALVDLTALRGRPLTWLSLSGCTSLKRLSGIEGAPLTRLDLSDCHQLEGDLAALHAMPLRELVLARCTRLPSITGLSSPALAECDARGCENLRGDLTALKGTALTRLNLSGCVRLERISGIEQLPLIDLDLGGCDRLAAPEMPGVRKPTPLHQLAGLASLRRLSLAKCSWVRDLAPLASLRLTRLDLSGCGDLDGDLKGLALMPLEFLDLTNCSDLDALTGLENAPLKRLVVRGASGISGKKLEPVLGKPDLVIER